jgi:uncharacterized protein YhbP (UPF0306 family)
MLNIRFTASQVTLHGQMVGNAMAALLLQEKVRRVSCSQTPVNLLELSWIQLANNTAGYAS